MNKLFLYALCVFVGSVLAGCSAMRLHEPEPGSFEAFYDQLRDDVAAKGLKPRLLDKAFPDGPIPVQAVLRKQETQPELVRSFREYSEGLMSEARIERGVAEFIQHRGKLANITEETGVPGEVVVALWGVESNFGDRMGRHSVVQGLATLAWQSSRSDFFKKELFAALEIAQKQKKHPLTLEGSWAGAMGQCQFMPRSYLAYAKDGDGDGFADIWHNEDDVLASGANFLKMHGWKRDVPWKLEVSDLLDMRGVDVNKRGLSEPLTLAEWRKRGFATAWKLPLNENDELRAFTPEKGGKTVLLGENFDVILRWNRSSYFAYSVLAIADEIAARASAKEQVASQQQP